MTDILPSHLFFEESGEGSKTDRQIQVIRSGSTHLGIFAEVIKTVAEWQQPAPLPHSPKAVLGVVGIHGHMLTLIDPLILLGKDEHYDYSSGKILALRGDEQLGLAVQEVIDMVWVSLSNTEPMTQNHRRPVLTHFNHQKGTILLLNEKELFAAAMQGRERRRRRF